MPRSKRRGRFLVPLIALWIAIPGTFVVFILLAQFVPFIGTKVYNLIPSRKQTRETLRRVAQSRAFNPDWLDAIGYVESRWDSLATNYTGGDLARGGALGSTQMTWETLLSLGYSGTKEEFLHDTEAQARWSINYLQQVKPPTFADAVAWWNAGYSRFDKLPANHPTRTKYWPKAQAALATVTTEVSV